ncbi:hypothetical protein LTR85_009091 [Meristemomyces frigidus]|nr:hypothetical protein LTR85_009091 [Meristemomyces frigidus]
MNSASLIRFGIKTTILDDRQDKTSTGRADGLQPKSIETLRQMRLVEPLLRQGVKVYDISFWSSTATTPLRRTGREVHYPPLVDVLEPYILLFHEGLVEEVFLDDMRARGIEVTRSSPFVSYHQGADAGTLEVVAQDLCSGKEKRLHAKYLVGTDGAHSQVRKCIRDAKAVGASSDAIWGVLDGVIDTDFPDLWSKVIVHAEESGSVLCIPRERNMTRLYIELKSECGAPVGNAEAMQDFVQARARAIMKPYSLRWESVEWFGICSVGQRVASRFTDDAQRVFIAGDASHTHSPKAAQGMNTSMHDTLNLAWKLNLAVRGLAKPELLATYEHERRKIAQDLIEFDFEHANAFHAGDAESLVRNFQTNVRFISGVGAEYNSNVLNRPTHARNAGLRPGCLLEPARATRYIDANPVNVQLDIPMLGQFRIYFFCRNIHAVLSFLSSVCSHISSGTSVLGSITSAAKSSYAMQAPVHTESREFVQPGRYTATSNIFTYALITTTPKAEFELADLPPLLQASRWTVYLDDIPHTDTRGLQCTDKWLGGLDGEEEVAIVNVRPDGYVGSIGRWKEAGDPMSAKLAATWLDEYYGGFLKA